MTERDGLTRSTPRLAPPLSQEKNAAWKKNRNNHARLLLHQLGVGRLEAPFDKMPYDGRLAMLPPHALYCLAFGGGGGGGGLSGGSGRWNARRASKECSNDRRRGPFLESVGKTSYRSLLDDFGAPTAGPTPSVAFLVFSSRPVVAPARHSLAARVHPPTLRPHRRRPELADDAREPRGPPPTRGGVVRDDRDDDLRGPGGGETASHTTPFAWCTPFLKDFSRRHSSPALPFQRLTGKTFD
jgi:hypothetical protein